MPDNPLDTPKCLDPDFAPREVLPQDHQGIIHVAEVAVHQREAVELLQGAQAGQGQRPLQPLVVLDIEVQQVLQLADRGGQRALKAVFL